MPAGRVFGDFDGQVMLVVFGGLPATGKTTISRRVAARRHATFLRIDVIEQALRSAGVLAGDVGAAGYVIAHALASSNLANGQIVVVDCVNPVSESRRGWHEQARRAGTPLVEVEIVCSDAAEHRRRVETRTSDIEGQVLPDWRSVQTHNYVPWTEPHLVVDTADLSVAEAVERVERQMRHVLRPPS